MHDEHLRTSGTANRRRGVGFETAETTKTEPSHVIEDVGERGTWSPLVNGDPFDGEAPVLDGLTVLLEKMVFDMDLRREDWLFLDLGNSECGTGDDHEETEKSK